MTHDTIQRYPLQTLSPIEYCEWADPEVMRSFFEGAEASRQNTAKPLTVSPLRRLIRSLRIRIITRSPL